jgi:hypothetical protein
MRLRATILHGDGRPPTERNVLNEIVIDRGPSPYLCCLEVWEFGGEIHVSHL